MGKVFILVQESNCDGEILVNVIPCADLETAKAEMQREIDTLLSECGKYQGIDLNKIDRETFSLERDEMRFHIACNYDDYYERLDIVEKEIVKKG